MRSSCAWLLALACVPALCGCGLGAGSTPGAVRMTVSSNFGGEVLRAAAHPKISGQETVMSLLLRNYKVHTRYGGAFVQGIEDRDGGEREGRPYDWFYYVNGVEAQKGAAATDVHGGDRIWWDLHDWSATEDVPAVVGSYPEPFLDGIAGKRLPVRVECSREAGEACQTVAARLQRAGVPAAVGALGAGGGPDLLRVLVGPWRELRAERQLQKIEHGPRESGVYATPAPDGSTLTLLDRDGRPVRKLAGGAGLIAATDAQERTPIWAVTGTDPAGVALAAQAMNEATLRNRFAIAVTGGGPQPLPVAREAAQ